MTVTAVDVSAYCVDLPAGPVAHGSPVWVEARPNLRRAYVLAGDIHAALGKRHDLTGRGRNEHHEIALASTWLRAHGCPDLIITDAQRLHSKILGTLTQLAIDAGVDLWLLHRTPTSDAFLRALERRSDVTKNLHDMPQPVLAPVFVETTAAPFPQVPRHDIHLFRAVCQERLPAEDLLEVLELLDSVADHAFERMSLHGTDAATVARLLEEILDEAPGDDRLITAVRGLQLTAWHHDAFVRVDLDMLLHTEDRPRQSASVVDRVLSMYRQPHRVLTCALTRRGHPLDDIAAIELCDVTDGGRQIMVAGHQVHVREPGARRMCSGPTTRARGRCPD